MNSRAGVSRFIVEHIVYVFEGFRLDAGRRQLSSRGGVVVPLSSRAMEALVMLVSRAGELVTKKQLLEGVWPSAVVEENNINQCILAIRKALGESAGSNRFVMTVPGRGYRFVAPVVLQRKESAEPSAPHADAAQGRSRWAWFAVAALPALGGLVLLATGVSRDRIESQLMEASDQLIVHLRSQGDAATPAADVLLACLQQRPDLHLQVEVHVIGGDAGSPVWSGRYIAGAQDLLPEQEGGAVSGADAGTGTRHHPPAGDACRQLAAR